jgi:hypothetical protein
VKVFISLRGGVQERTVEVAILSMIVDGFQTTFLSRHPYHTHRVILNTHN